MDTKPMNLSEDYQVVMANSLVKAKSNLTVNEIKLLRLTIMNIVKEDIDFQTYSLRAIDFAELLNIDRHNLYRDLDRMTTNIMKELIYVRDGKNYTKFQWCSECSYNDGVITIKLHDRLKPFLIQLKEYYTQYALADILSFSSANTIKIYELIRQTLGLYHKKVYADKVANIEISVDDIREATDTQNKYTDHSMFKKWVVDKSINEINEKSGYHITYSPIIQNRKVVKYSMTVMSRVYAKELASKSKETKSKDNKKAIDDLLHITANNLSKNKK